MFDFYSQKYKQIIKIMICIKTIDFILLKMVYLIYLN